MANVTVQIWKETVKGLLSFIDQSGQRAEIQTRKILPPSANSVEQRIQFTTFAVIDKMAFTTPKGKTTFDSVGVERKITELGYFEYQDNITSELWLLFQGRRFDILTVNDIGDLNGIIKLELEFTGDFASEASKS